MLFYFAFSICDIAGQTTPPSLDSTQPDVARVLPAEQLPRAGVRERICFVAFIAVFVLVFLSYARDVFGCVVYYHASLPHAVRPSAITGSGIISLGVAWY